MKCPCRGCERRAPKCHGKCHDYEDWKIERAAISDWNREKNDPCVSDSIIRKRWVNQRFRNRKHVTNK